MIRDPTCGILVVYALAFVTAQYEPQDKTEGLKTVLRDLVKECADKNNIEMAEVMSAVENKYVQYMNPCFLGCIFEKTGMINEKGTVQPEVAVSNLEKYISGQDLTVAASVIKKCADQVNNEKPKDICESGGELAPCLTNTITDYITKLGVEAV